MQEHIDAKFDGSVGCVLAFFHDDASHDARGAWQSCIYEMPFVLEKLGP